LSREGLANANDFGRFRECCSVHLREQDEDSGKPCEGNRHAQVDEGRRRDGIKLITALLFLLYSIHTCGTHIEITWLVLIF
jgi:hypothetical protein